MHGTLRRPVNVVLICVWTLAAAALLILYREDAVVPMIAGGAVGLVAGVCQGLAIVFNPSAFARARSSAEVRRQLMASWPGRLSIALLWLGGILIGWLVWNLSRAYLLGTFAAGYVTLMLARELSALPFLGRIEDDSR